MRPERNYLIHPSYIVLTLLLCGASSLFMAFSVAYIYLRIHSGIAAVTLPSLFYINTLILLASSYTISRASQAYLDDQTDRYRWLLIVSLVLSIVFLGSQLIAWTQLFREGIFINNSNMSAFMYLISGVHFAHVILGIPFLGSFIYESYVKMKEPVSVLIYFSDPEKRRRLKLLTIYWHFLDILWIYLVVFLFINSCIQ